MVKHFTLFIILIPTLCFGVQNDEYLFKVPYSQQIFEINPHALKSSSGQFFYQNLFRNLLWYENKTGLQPDLAKSCWWKNTKNFICILKEKLKWSDGSNLTATDFIQSYQLFLNHKSNNPRKDLFYNVKGAKEFSENKNSWSQVGIKSINSSTIEFILIKPDPDFEFVLSQTLTAPIKKIVKIDDFKNMPTTGPFQIEDYKKNSKQITFKRNPHYHRKVTPIKIAWIYLTEDTLQIPLYLNNEIDLVKRLPTSQIANWQNKSDFYSQEVLRFDYFGFNLKKITKPQRTILFTKIPFEEFKNLFHSKGRPGCFQFDKEFTGKEDLCFAQEQPNDQDKQILAKLKAEFLLSLAGGEDHQRAAEWIQSQWKKIFNFDVSIRILENKIFLQQLKNKLPEFYRKGIPLEAATCHNALKIFSPDSPENLNRINDSELNLILKKFSSATTKSETQKLCLAGLTKIINELYIIPTGKFDLSYLIKPKYKNLNFNRLNYLDLSQLSLESP